MRKNKLISRGENIPNKKSIKFTEKQMPKQEVVTLKFFYSNEEYNFSPNPLLSKTIKQNKKFNFIIFYFNYKKDSCMISIPNVKEESFQFVVQFLLDICCIPHVDKASINEVYYEEVPVKAPANNTTNNNTEKKEGENQEKIHQKCQHY